jgi:hypothetical protein
LLIELLGKGFEAFLENLGRSIFILLGGKPKDAYKRVKEETRLTVLTFIAAIFLIIGILFATRVVFVLIGSVVILCAFLLFLISKRHHSRHDSPSALTRPTPIPTRPVSINSIHPMEIVNDRNSSMLNNPRIEIETERRLEWNCKTQTFVKTEPIKISDNEESKRIISFYWYPQGEDTRLSVYREAQMICSFNNHLEQKIINLCQYLQHDTARTKIFRGAYKSKTNLEVGHTKLRLGGTINLHLQAMGYVGEWVFVLLIHRIIEPTEDLDLQEKPVLTEKGVIRHLRKAEEWVESTP